MRHHMEAPPDDFTAQAQSVIVLIMTVPGAGDKPYWPVGIPIDPSL